MTSKDREQAMSKFQLHGGMIPRTVRRMFDHRSEPREEAVPLKALLSLRGKNHPVELVNLSPSGAMVLYAGDARIGEAVRLQLIDRGGTDGQVRWLRDGRMGIYFERPLD